MLIDSTMCYACEYVPAQKNISIDTLAPQLNISSFEFKSPFLFEKFKLYESKPESGLRQDLSGRDVVALQEPHNRWQKAWEWINKLIKRKRGDFDLFLILRVNNPLIRKKACKDLIALKDERVFRLLRIMGVYRGTAENGNGKFRERAERALLDMHKLNPILSQKLGLKKSLFEIVLSDSVVARSRAIGLLEKMGIRTEEGLDQILKWLDSGSWVLISKGAKQIQTLNKRRLAMIKERKAIFYLIKSVSSGSMTEPVFLSVINAMKKLQAQKQELEEAARSCFLSINNSPGARRKAAIILAEVSADKKRTLRLLVRVGLKDEYLAVRKGAIEAITKLGEFKGIRFLKTYRQRTQNLMEQMEEKNFSYFNYRDECVLIDEAVTKLEMPRILGLYDVFTQKHVINVYKLAEIVADAIDLDREGKNILMRAVLKHDLEKSIKRHCIAIGISPRDKQGDVALGTIRTERSFVLKYLLEKYDIDTSIEEHLLIRNHRRPGILRDDFDFKGMPQERRKK